VTQDIRWKQRFDNFQRALHQLTLAMELKAQRPLTEQGLVGSRSTAREAFKRGLVLDGEVWMDMIEKRNLSSHTYNQAVANILVASVAERYYSAFCELKQRFAKEA
jgi:nucleotidyltransferase substrate binding protein (TIGR01987 family)